MRRLFVDTIAEVGESVELDATAMHHARVLRLEEGSEVELFDGRGMKATARITAFDASSLRCVVSASSHVEARESARLVLVQSMPKGEKLEAIVRMSTEIGVDEIRLVLSERTIARPDSARASAKVERLTRVVREAARQSERSTLPEICEPKDLLACAAEASKDVTHLVFTPYSGRGIDDVRDRVAEAKEVWVWVGPEGGFSPAELEALSKRGHILVRIFDSVLRVETASPVAVALVRSLLLSSR